MNTARHSITEKRVAIFVIYLLPLVVLAVCLVALPFWGQSAEQAIRTGHTGQLAALFVLLTQVIYVFFSRSKIQAARSVLPVIYISFAVIALIPGVFGVVWLEHFLRLHEPIPAVPDLMTAPGKVFFGILLILIAALPMGPSNGLAKRSPSTNGLVILSILSMLFGLLAFILGGLVWLVLSRGNMPDFMTSTEWLFTLVFLPGSLLFVAGICGVLKLGLHMKAEISAK